MHTDARSFRYPPAARRVILGPSSGLDDANEGKGALMSDAASFSSECPTCGHERLLTGYARDELVELLRAGAEIEGYCISCDERWSISTEERADLVRALSRPK